MIKATGKQTIEERRSDLIYNRVISRKCEIEPVVKKQSKKELDAIYDRVINRKKDDNMAGCTNPTMRKLVEFANRQTEIIFKDTTAGKSESVMDVGNDVQVHIYPGSRDEETTMPSAIICCDVCPAASECRAN